MRLQLSVSNIAWPPEDHDAAIAHLLSLGIAAIEVAPFNAFGSWGVDAHRIGEFRKRLEHAGVTCPAMQGILYNVPGAHLFQSPESRAVMRTHLESVARMAGILGARSCVFGAPRLRDPGDLTQQEASEIAADFLRSIGPVFDAEGAILCFEPNAAVYACRFVTTTAQAMELVELVDTSGIGVQIDTGTVFLEGEDPAVLTRATGFAPHAHVSEPNLAPIGSSGVDHKPLADAIAAGGYRGSISIEMKSTPNWRENVERAVAMVRESYLK